ncbi:hypothetical protein O0L34_g8424 [Tuta absoluta]|nr:hypothetical protein O0L34_g8424 [Tuta absoluta]
MFTRIDSEKVSAGEINETSINEVSCGCSRLTRRMLGVRRRRRQVGELGLGAAHMGQRGAARRRRRAPGSERQTADGGGSEAAAPRRGGREDGWSVARASAECGALLPEPAGSAGGSSGDAHARSRHRRHRRHRHSLAGSEIRLFPRTRALFFTEFDFPLSSKISGSSFI